MRRETADLSSAAVPSAEVEAATGDHEVLMRGGQAVRPSETSSGGAKRALRIAYVIPSTDVSGGVAVVCQHANRLQARGHDVVLASEMAGRSMDWFPGQSVPVTGLKELPSDLDCLVATGWQTSFRVATLPARHRFYFVQSDETRFHPSASPWKHITRLSYLLDMDFLTEARWIKRWLLESFDKDAELVPNGLDETIFHPAQPLEPRHGRPRVLLEGALDLPYKGMAEAYAAVEHEDVDIWIVSSLGRPPRGWRYDRFFSQVPMSKMRQVYSSCDILLKLSRVEGFFGPPMEMMACGGAVVVGRVSGYDEYIEDGVNALVVDAERPDEATAAVRRLIQEPGLRLALVEAGAETARRWRWEPSIDILERFYLDVVEGRRGITPSRAARQRSFSVAYFFGMLRGEVWIERDDESQGPMVELQSGPAGDTGAETEPGRPGSVPDPTEKLLGRLRRMGWFRATAELAYRVYVVAKALRGKARSVRRTR